jgi:sugar transferase EpsL
MAYRVKQFIKNSADRIIALVLLVLFSPLMLLVSILVLFCCGRPIVFKQKRPGLHANPFEIYKFRTMTNKKDEQGVLLQDSLRMTRLGKLLRKYSLDELPQLINVLKGELSIVGPRPLLMKYLPLYDKKQARRHEVKPGITGWAQVNGRNAISWEQKFDLDVWYVDNHSFMLDFKIIMKTVFKVLKVSQVNQDDCTTMAEFTGTMTEVSHGK